MNVPKLRFKEFNDEWIETKIQNVATVIGGGTPSTDEPKYWGNEINWFTPSEIGKTKYVTISNRKISQDGLKNSSAKLLPKGTILLSSRATVGEASILLNEASTNQGFQSLIVNENNCNEFIYYLKYKYKREMLIKSFGSTFLEISKSNVENIKIKIPSKEEQFMIANFLSLLDKKIELQSKKIEDLKLFKKGLIQKIFSSNNLSEVKIKDLGTIITGTTPSKENKNYWNDGTIAWITPTDINYERDISNSITSLTKEGLKKGRFVPKNSILVTCIASIGKNAVIKVDGSCNQQINAIIPNNKFNSNYIYYLMEYISPYLQSIAGTSATAIVNKETFERIKVKVHNYNDQSRIDKYLSSVETKILLEDKLLNKLIKLKKGLMQSMFV